MGETTIEWTDKVWNPVTGCTKVSAGCKNCYAERMFHRPYPGRAFTDVRTHPERLDQPLRWRKPCRIFVNSMSDLFHESIDLGSGFHAKVFNVARLTARHTYHILTKRPARMLELMREMTNMSTIFMGKPLPNVWLGVSVEDQATADERIPLLLQTPAAVRWVSYEPALGPVDLDAWLRHHFSDCACIGCQEGRQNHRLDWIVAGGESGPGARPSHPDWFRSVRDQCQAAGVPFFFKQWGEWAEAEGSGVGSRDSGEKLYPGRHDWTDGTIMIRFGKKRAGRLLDGREWNEFPQTEQSITGEQK